MPQFHRSVLMFSHFFVISGNTGKEYPHGRSSHFQLNLRMLVTLKEPGRSQHLEVLTQQLHVM